MSEPKSGCRAPGASKFSWRVPLFLRGRDGNREIRGGFAWFRFGCGVEGLGPSCNIRLAELSFQFPRLCLPISGPSR